VGRQERRKGIFWGGERMESWTMELFEERNGNCQERMEASKRGIKLAVALRVKVVQKKE